jgi:hypothetical protein
MVVWLGSGGAVRCMPTFLTGSFDNRGVLSCTEACSPFSGGRGREAGDDLAMDGGGGGQMLMSSF